MTQTTGELSATGQVTLTKPSTETLTMVALSGDFTGLQFKFEGTVNGTNWFGIAAIDVATGALVSAGTISPTDATPAAWKVPSEGLSGVRVNVTAITTEEATFYFSSGSYNAVPFMSQSVTGASSLSALHTFAAGIAFSGATTVNVITMPDNLADALNIKEGSTSYLKFVTTDGSERIVVGKQMKAADSVKIAFGDADDITMAWDGTDFDVLQATANSSIKWGVDGAGIDQVWYGDTASTNMTWDQSADSLIFTGQAYIEGNKMKTVANTDGTLTIDATHSGKMITTRGASGATTITLPTVAAGFTGVHFWVFNCVDQDLTLSAQTAGEIMFKNDLAADTVAYATASEKIGGGFFVHCDGTSWLVMPLAEEAQTITVT